jgi:hypothetical protein
MQPVDEIVDGVISRCSFVAMFEQQKRFSNHEFFTRWDVP